MPMYSDLKSIDDFLAELKNNKDCAGSQSQIVRIDRGIKHHGKYLEQITLTATARRGGNEILRFRRQIDPLPPAGKSEEAVANLEALAGDLEARCGMLGFEVRSGQFAAE